MATSREDERDQVPNSLRCHEQPSTTLRSVGNRAASIGVQGPDLKYLLYQHFSPQIQLELRDKLLHFTDFQIVHMAEIIEHQIHPPLKKSPYVTDRISGICFLIDSGSTNSTILPTPEERTRKPPLFWIEYSKGQKYAVYGWRELVVDLGMQQTFKWKFIIGDIKVPVIGADFLSYFDINIDFKKRAIVENRLAPVLDEDKNIIKSYEGDSCERMRRMLFRYLQGARRPLEILEVMQGLASRECLLNESWKTVFMTFLPPFLLPDGPYTYPTVYELAVKAEKCYELAHRSTCHCLHFTDVMSGLRFLIDSGAERSEIPQSSSEMLIPLPYARFVSANGTPVVEYGYKYLTVYLGPDGHFFWRFLITDTDMPLIGADFLSHFGLTIDLKRRRLIRDK